MIKLETLISNAMHTVDSDVYFKGVLIVNRGTPQEYYIDPRTWERPDGLKVILPICFHGGHDWYICPDCGQLHPAYRYGKRETGCCDDIDCMRQVGKGSNSFFLQRNPVIIADWDGNL